MSSAASGSITVSAVAVSICSSGAAAADALLRPATRRSRVPATLLAPGAQNRCCGASRLRGSASSTCAREYSRISPRRSSSNNCWSRTLTWASGAGRPVSRNRNPPVNGSSVPRLPLSPSRFHSRTRLRERVGGAAGGVTTVSPTSACSGLTRCRRPVTSGMCGARGPVTAAVGGAVDAVRTRASRDLVATTSVSSATASCASASSSLRAKGRTAPARYSTMAPGWAMKSE